MISIAIVWLALYFNEPWVVFLVFITWIPDVVLILGVLDSIQKKMELNQHKTPK